jgi:hypothetical protein
MSFTSIAELPQRLHPVEPDTFLDPPLVDRLEPVIEPAELRLRARRAELAA